MKSNKTIFLRWCMIAGSILFGIAYLIYYNIFSMVNAGDVTKLSLCIFGIFILCTAYIGKASWFLYKGKEIKNIHIVEFFTTHLLSLGLVGTIIGFIYMLSTTFAHLNPAETNTLRCALVNMSLGMSTALYTTASGLICSLILRLQLLNLETKNEE